MLLIFTCSIAETDNEFIEDSAVQRRITKPPTHLSTIQKSTPFPKEVDSFWSSNQNKLKLQKLIYQETQTHTSKYPIVLGEVETSSEEWQCINVQNNELTPILQSQSSYTQADLRILSHVLDCVVGDCKTVLVVSKDTYVILELLHHIPVFNDHNLQELWIRAGAGQTDIYHCTHYTRS